MQWGLRSAKEPTLDWVSAQWLGATGAPGADGRGSGTRGVPEAAPRRHELHGSGPALLGTVGVYWRSSQTPGILE
jgi:hypothetical protein